MAIKAAILCGLKEEIIYKSIKRIKDVNGRLELVKNYSNDVKFFVDYAHTPDALFKTLKSLESFHKKYLSSFLAAEVIEIKKKTIHGNDCEQVL